MSLIKCPECQKEISHRVEFCINCGFKLQQTSPVWVIFKAIPSFIMAVFWLGILGLFLYFWLLGG